MKPIRFHLLLDNFPFKKGEIIHYGKGRDMKVLKVYYSTWWRQLLKRLKFLKYFGYRSRINQIKVELL